ncbi:S8 family serine peptidase [Candidatus Woesearchaeota archaeon]|nr:S8 family serine peptidase [Candidatus Woesearchaeota archaeon]
MKNITKRLTLLFLTCVSSIFAFNTSLNESNNSSIIILEEISPSSNISLEEVNPYKDKESKKIKFRYYETDLDDTIKTKVKDKLKILTSNNKEYFILQFNRNPSKQEIKELKSEGIRLVQYISNDTWYILVEDNFDNIFEIDKNNDLKLKNSKFDDKYLVRNIGEIKKAYKVKSKRNEKKFSFWTKDENNNLYLLVKFQKDLTMEEAKEIMTQNDFEVMNEIPTINSLTVKMSENDFDKLLDLNEVVIVEEIPFYFGNQLSSSREIINANVLQNFSTYNLTGTGIIILQYEGNIPYEHSDLNGRINNQEPPFSSDTSNHATRVAGIMVGAGTLNYSYRGIAIKADLIAYETDYNQNNVTDFYDNVNNVEDEYLDGIRDHGAVLASNSWGQNIKRFLPGYNETPVVIGIDNCDLYGDYEAVGELFDKIVYHGAEDTIWPYTDSRPIPIVVSIGNERDGLSNPCKNVTEDTNPNYPYYTIDPIKGSKNTIGVGAVEKVLNYYQPASFSSYGPTDAGRLKPEIVAPGCVISADLNDSYSYDCGTSFSAPHVSGTIALMFEQWTKTGYSGVPLPSTIKTILLDSALDLANGEGGEVLVDGPDYVNGYGLLNAKGAVDRIINGTFLEANISDISDVDVYAINISAQSSLKVTLAWDDVPGANLINDLDLKLLSPSGQTFYPWTLDPNTPAREAWRNESDHLNNVEQVYVNTSEIESGQWLVVVSASDCNALDCPQKYSLASEEELAPVSPFNNSYGLIGYWKGENTSLDSSANNKSATLGSAVTYTTSGPFGTAFDLPGTSGTSYLDLPINGTIKTLSFWVNFRSGTGNKYLVTNSDVGYLGQGTVVNWPGDRTIDSLLGNGVYAFNDFGTLSLNTWYYVTFVSTGSGQEYYLNGAYKGLTVGAINSLSEASLYLGRHPTPSYEVNCLLDEISVWGVSLNQSSIYQLYAASMENFDTPTSPPSNSGLPANASLLGHWKGENSVLDNSSYHHDGSKGSSVTYNSWGIDGSSFDLPGTSGTSYLDLPINGTIKTLSFWVNFRSGSGNKYLVTNSDVGYLGQGTVLNWPGDRTIDALLGNGTYEYDAFGQLSLNTWHHVTFVSTSSGLQYYLNGTFIGSKSGAENTLPEASLYFGRHPTASYEVNCLLDEISVWNTSLNGDEVFQLFEEGISYE